jgi:imidazolonepropionase-like amidohydrolase
MLPWIRNDSIRQQKLNMRDSWHEGRQPCRFRLPKTYCLPGRWHRKDADLIGVFWRYARTRIQSREQALRMFMTDAAYAASEEKIKGFLTPGKPADMVALSKAIRTIPVRQILETSVELTSLGGKVV